MLKSCYSFSLNRTINELSVKIILLKYVTISYSSSSNRILEWSFSASYVITEKSQIWRTVHGSDGNLCVFY